jgi:hypothetical protein
LLFGGKHHKREEAPNESELGPGILIEEDRDVSNEWQISYHSADDVFRDDPELASIVQPAIINGVVVSFGQNDLLSSFTVQG